MSLLIKEYKYVYDESNLNINISCHTIYFFKIQRELIKIYNQEFSDDFLRSKKRKILIKTYQKMKHFMAELEKINTSQYAINMEAYKNSRKEIINSL